MEPAPGRGVGGGLWRFTPYRIEGGGVDRFCVPLVVAAET